MKEFTVSLTNAILTGSVDTSVLAYIEENYFVNITAFTEKRKFSCYFCKKQLAEINKIMYYYISDENTLYCDGKFNKIVHFVMHVYGIDNAINCICSADCWYKLYKQIPEKYITLLFCLPNNLRVTPLGIVNRLPSSDTFMDLVNTCQKEMS